MKNIKKIFIGVLAMLFVPSIAKAESFKVGDYVSMTPTSNNYTSTIPGSSLSVNPSELTLWRIIDIHADGSFDAVSEYVSSNLIEVRGTNGYKNFNLVLNQAASAYENSTYTKGSRMMGFDGQTLSISDISSFNGTMSTAPSTTSTPKPLTGTGQEYSGGVLGDTLYLKDIKLVGDVYKSNPETYGTNGLKTYKADNHSSSSTYFLASRLYRYADNENYYFGFRYISDDGYLMEHDSLVAYEYEEWDTLEDSWNESSFGYRLRPILTFKPELYIESGSGTKDSPYTLTLVPSGIVSSCTSFSAKPVTLKVGETLNYKKTLGEINFRYDIKDTSIATIDKNGIITAKKEGTTTLEVFGDCNSQTTTITVKKASDTIKNEETKEETKVNEDIEAKETVKNPKTGNQPHYLLGLFIITCSFISYVVLKNKKRLG